MHIGVQVGCGDKQTTAPCFLIMKNSMLMKMSLLRVDFFTFDWSNTVYNLHSLFTISETCPCCTRNRSIMATRDEVVNIARGAKRGGKGVSSGMGGMDTCCHYQRNPGPGLRCWYLIRKPFSFKLWQLFNGWSPFSGFLILFIPLSIDWNLFWSSLKGNKSLPEVKTLN